MRAEITFDDLWLARLALGGDADSLTVDSHVLDVLRPGSYQHNLIAQAINESLLERGGNPSGGLRGGLASVTRHACGGDEQRLAEMRDGEQPVDPRSDTGEHEHAVHGEKIVMSRHDRPESGRVEDVDPAKRRAGRTGDRSRAARG